MTKIYNPPMMQNIGPPVDMSRLAKLRAALLGPQYVHGEILVIGSYKELEERLSALLTPGASDD